MGKSPAAELFSFEIKEKAGFAKGGEKNFDGTIADLEMKTYLCVKDFQQKVNKKGQKYGWSVAIYTMPESILGYDYVTKAYSEKPEESEERIVARMKEIFPNASEKQIRKIVR